MKIIVDQIMLMAILMFVGFVLRKRDYFDEEVTKGLSKFLLRIVIPMTIIESFMQPFSWAVLKEIVIIGVIMVLITFLLIFLGNVVFKEHHQIEKYATIFTNKGFIGIPIITALFGKEAVSLVTPMVVVGHVFMWTYGINLLSEDKVKLNIKQIVLNPSFIALIIGMILFVLPINDYPFLMTKSMSSLTSLNTPLAMIILGVYLANENVSEVFTNKMAYYVSFLRLIVTPVLTLIIMKFLPIDIIIKQVFIIMMAVPSAANTAMFSEMVGKNPSYGAQIVSQTTILCAVTLPMIIWLMEIAL